MRCTCRAATASLSPERFLPSHLFTNSPNDRQPRHQSVHLPAYLGASDIGA
jgi:hypothetical protein